jgi:hypothetical protein
LEREFECAELGGPGRRPGSDGALDRLISAIERAARAGWPEAARLIALLAVAAAVALVIMASR